MSRLILATLSILLPALAIAAESPGWPQWRGPSRDGTLPNQHLAVRGDDVFIRDLFGLTAFRWSSEK